jgi:hypothetical protein
MTMITSVMGIVGICVMGIGVSSGLNFFHDFEFKFKQKGDKNVSNAGQSLRERAKGLS